MLRKRAFPRPEARCGRGAGSCGWTTRCSTYSVMQSDLNSSKTDTFDEPITSEPHVYTSFEQLITFARHEYGRLDLRIKISSDVIASRKMSIFQLIPSDCITL